MIRPETLDKFSEILKPCGFRSRAFTACYGMAECTLGVSFSSLERGFTTDILDSDHLSEHHEALVLSGGNKDGRGRHFVNCGRVLSSFEIEIRDKGKVLGDMQSGLIFLRGPSVMSGYFNSPDETESVLSEDGWLNTGDIGYMSSGVLTITGRKKDIIIIHGKNIWPQDLEYVAESQDDIRSGDVVAFSAPGVEGEERCVLLVQCREQNTEKRRLLIEKLTSVVRTETGIDCHVELVPSHSLPRTSSGKLSRSKARLNFLAELEHRAAEMDFYTPVAARVASA